MGVMAAVVTVSPFYSEKFWLNLSRCLVTMNVTTSTIDVPMRMVKSNSRSVIPKGVSSTAEGLLSSRFQIVNGRVDPVDHLR